MASLTQGRVVVHRPTEFFCRVLLWDQEDGLVLLEPVVIPPFNSNSNNNSNGNKSTARWRGSRWVFEKDLVLVETMSERARKKADGTSRGSPADKDVSSHAAGKHTDASRESDATLYARRSAKLDDRVVFRTDKERPQRGRGLFAVKDVPAGTEIMRVRAAGAVLMRHRAKHQCGRCFTQLQPTDKSVLVCATCEFSFCYDCATADDKDGAHRTTCRSSRNVTSIQSGAEVGDEAVIRLVANCLARRKTCVIDDEEWDLIESLDAHENETGTMGLGSAALQECVIRFDHGIGYRVTREDVQTMYRRMCRNSHPVQPDPLSVGASTVQALFPFAALVNHSCEPNSFFHTTTSPSANGLGLEYVLRTTRNVTAGQELCSSYVRGHGGVGVLDRQVALESWGFRCDCSRCQDEIEEERNPEKNTLPEDGAALANFNAIKAVFHRLAGNSARETENDKNHELVVDALTFIGKHREHVSPSLLRRLSTCTLDCALALRVSEAETLMSACMHAGNALASVWDCSAIDMWHQQHQHAIKLALSARGPRKELYLRVAKGAVSNAIEASEIYFGSQHPYTLKLDRLRATTTA